MALLDAGKPVGVVCDAAGPDLTDFVLKQDRVAADCLHCMLAWVQVALTKKQLMATACLSYCHLCHFSNMTRHSIQSLMQHFQLQYHRMGGDMRVQQKVQQVKPVIIEGSV